VKHSFPNEARIKHLVVDKTHVSLMIARYLSLPGQVMCTCPFGGRLSISTSYTRMSALRRSMSGGVPSGLRTCQ
jgi:hypothetical protein